MSLHSCIHLTEKIENADERVKEGISNILYKLKNDVFNIKFREVTMKQQIKKMLKMFYALDCVNKHLPNSRKIVICDIKNDRECRRIVKEYIDTKIKLNNLQKEIKKLNFDEYNPLEYSSDKIEEDYIDNSILDEISEKYTAEELIDEFDWTLRGIIAHSKEGIKIQKLSEQLEE